MGGKKLRVVHFLNQFFGQIGSEEKATSGFVVKEGPWVLAWLYRKSWVIGEVVATVICGDDYFAGNLDKNAEEGLKLVGCIVRARPFFRRPCFCRWEIRCCLRGDVQSCRDRVGDFCDYRDV